MKTLLTVAALFAATQAAVLPAPGLAAGLDGASAGAPPATQATPFRIAGLMTGGAPEGGGFRPPGATGGSDQDRPPFGPPGMNGRGRHGPPKAEMVAMRLAAMEVAVGVRADQIDAWRDFTDALIGVLTPPEPPAPPTPGEAKDPFAFAEMLAKSAAERGHYAEALQRAIARLKTVLSAEQLQRLARFERSLASPGLPKGAPRGAPDAGGPAPEPPAGPVE